MAEDFAFYNVAITTVPPEGSYKHVRIVSEDEEDFIPFDDPLGFANPYTESAWVWFRNHSIVNTRALTPKATGALIGEVANTAVHETGHLFTLRHGFATPWSIMCSGDCKYPYGSNVSFSNRSHERLLYILGAK